MILLYFCVVDYILLLFMSSCSCKFLYDVDFLFYPRLRGKSILGKL